MTDLLEEARQWVIFFESCGRDFSPTALANDIRRLIAEIEATRAEVVETQDRLGSLLHEAERQNAKWQQRWLQEFPAKPFLTDAGNAED